MDVPEIYNPDDYKQYSKDIEYDMQRFKDPYVMGAMIHRLVEERKYTNVMLKAILKKLDELGKVAEHKAPKQEQILSEIEEQIVLLARQQGKTSAEDVQRVLNYKGKNGASAKLNSLHRMGLLDKRRAGKKVYFLPV